MISIGIIGLIKASDRKSKRNSDATLMKVAFLLMYSMFNSFISISTIAVFGQNEGPMHHFVMGIAL